MNKDSTFAKTLKAAAIKRQSPEEAEALFKEAENGLLDQLQRMETSPNFENLESQGAIKHIKKHFAALYVGWNKVDDLPEPVKKLDLPIIRGAKPTTGNN